MFSAPSTLGDIVKRDNSTHNAYQQLANVVILVSLLIAGCTLATGIAAGLADRKRPFSLLRLTGARLATLRRVVALEGAVPLLSVAVVAIGAGFAGAAMFATEAQNHPMVAPGIGYYLLTGGGIIAVPRHHRGHLPAARAHNRPRGRQERVNAFARWAVPYAEADGDAEPVGDAESVEVGRRRRTVGRCRRRGVGRRGGVRRRR